MADSVRMFSAAWHDLKAKILRGERARLSTVAPVERSPAEVRGAAAIEQAEQATTVPAATWPVDGCQACGGDGFFLVDGDVIECQACGGLG